MKIYSGKSSVTENSPLGSGVVWELLSSVKNPTTGTIRDFRTGRCPLKSPKEASKWQRGNFDYRSDGQVYICRWKDSAVVSIASNYSAHEPVSKAKIFCRAKKKKIDIPQPYLIKMYNEGMGGVDLLDRLLASYRPMFRSKKWYWNLFSNALNMTVVAGWILHSHLHKGTEVELSHLFRREVTLCLLRMKPKVHSVPGPRAHNFESLRKTDSHYLVPSTQGRCAVCQNTKNKCSECEKRLHQKCFPNYPGQ
ncbi:PiggyBac transposable element-derived protein 2, partial [Stegodyphus mimosarum]